MNSQMTASYCEVGQGDSTSRNSSKSVHIHIMCILIPSPSIVVLDDLICRRANNSTSSLELIIVLVKVDSLEVVELLLIEVGKVPVYSDVFKGQVVPFIVIGVVWVLVVMDVLACSEDTSNLDELPGVYLARPSLLFLQMGWNPSSVNDNGSSLHFNWILIFF